MDSLSSAPVIGDILSAKALGRKGTALFIWSICPSCKEFRWVKYYKGKPQSLRCKKCGGQYPRGDKSSNWRGGRYKNRAGYIVLCLTESDSFFSSMADKHRKVLEHRLVMAKHLNRCLLSWEVVHHKNGVKNDNRIENLELLPTIKQHLSSMVWRAELGKRDKRIRELEARLVLLEAELVQLRMVCVS